MGMIVRTTVGAAKILAAEKGKWTSNTTDLASSERYLSELCEALGLAVWHSFQQYRKNGRAQGLFAIRLRVAISAKFNAGA